MRPIGGFILRAPLLPFGELESLGAELAWPKLSANASDEELEAALAADRSKLGARLRAAIERPMIREAVHVAAPALDAELDRWIDGSLGLEHAAKVERALQRYFARMAARATPFGLFAGCSVGAIADATQLAIAPASEARRRSSVDVARVAQIAREVAREPEALEGMVLRPGSTLYRLGGQLRTPRTFLEPSDPIESTLARCRDGAEARDLSRALMESDARITLDDAREFLTGLLESGVLESELDPPLTGDDATLAQIEALRRLPATSSG